jgi:O-antigen/teichoic acid export membrane protein
MKRLVFNSLNYGLGDLMAQIIGFFLIPVYTRYLSPADYGIVELNSTLAAFAVPLMKFGLPGSVTRLYYDYKDQENGLKNLITTVNGLLNGLALASGVIILIFLYLFGESLLQGLEFFPFVVMAIITAGLGANSQLQQKIIQNREQSKYAMYLKLAFTFFSIALAFIFIVFFKMGALGFVLVSFLTALFFFFQARYYLKPDLDGRFDRVIAKESLKYGLGIMPNHLTTSASPFINSTVILKLGGMASLGLFSVGLRFFFPLEVVYNAINTAFVPIYNEKRKEGKNEELQVLVRQILGICLVVYAGYQVLGPYILGLLVPQNYLSSIKLMPILGIAFLGKSIYNISMTEVFYSKKTLFSSIVILSGLGTNLLTVFILGQLLGFYSGEAAFLVSWGFAIGFLFWGITSVVFKSRVSKFDLYLPEILVFLALGALITLIGFYLQGLLG